MFLFLANLFRSSIDNSVVVVHHFQYHGFVARPRNGRNWLWIKRNLLKLLSTSSHIKSYDISNSSKVSAIVQVLVLQSKVIPYKSPEYFEWSQYREDKVGIYVTHLNQGHRKSPSKAENQIFNNRQVVKPLKAENERKGFQSLLIIISSYSDSFMHITKKMRKIKGLKWKCYVKTAFEIKIMIQIQFHNNSLNFNWKLSSFLFSFVSNARLKKPLTVDG